ncbi:hypothetical protein [Catalinimonas alkaloidigena]|nr:hypothetical protein [Catalinimonas alkaloidigena]
MPPRHCLHLRHAHVYHAGVLCEIIDVQGDRLLARDGTGRRYTLSRFLLEGIPLTTAWLHRLGLQEGERLRNWRSGIAWVLRRTPQGYCLVPEGDAGAVRVQGALPYVHDLQRWHRGLTGRYLTLINDPGPETPPPPTP